MKHTKTITVEQVSHTCDLCESESALCLQREGCGIDLCDECRVLVFQDPWDGHDYGDYPMILCSECNALLTKYISKAAEIRDECDERIAVLEDLWKEDCNVRTSAKTDGEGRA